MEERIPVKISSFVLRSHAFRHAWPHFCGPFLIAANAFLEAIDPIWRADSAITEVQQEIAVILRQPQVVKRFKSNDFRFGNRWIQIELAATPPFLAMGQFSGRFQFFPDSGNDIDFKDHADKIGQQDMRLNTDSRAD